jgi:hypothetical protein
MANIFAKNPYQVVNNQQGVYQPTLPETLAQKSFVNQSPYYTPPRTEAIAVDTMAEKPKVFQAPALPQDNTSYSSILTNAKSALDSILQQVQGMKEQQAKPAETDGMAWLKKYMEDLPGTPNPVAIYNQAQQGVGLDTATQDVIARQNVKNQATNELNLLNAELQGIINETTQQGLRLREEGISAGAIRGRNIALEREAAIRALPLQSRALVAQANVMAAQGDLETAQATLKAAQDRIDLNYRLQMDYATSQYNYKTNLINKAYEFADRQQQAKLAQKQREEDNKWDLEKLKIKQQYDIQLENIKNRTTGAFGAISQLDVNDPNYFTNLMASTKGLKAPNQVETLRPIQKSIAVINQLSDLQASIKKTTTDPIIGTLRQFNPYDFDARAIQAQLQAVVPNLARGVYGEVGVLTDQDIRNYIQTLPNIKSTKEQNDFVMAMTLKTVQRNLESQLETLASAKYDISGFANQYNKISQQVKKMEDSLGINSVKTDEEAFKTLNEISTGTQESDQPILNRIWNWFTK